MQKAATRSPGFTCASLPWTSRTMPPTSDPGTNGRSGFIWYSPRVCSSSGKETPADLTSTTIPLPGVIGCSWDGSGTSASFSAVAGPERSVIWTARICAGILSHELLFDDPDGPRGGAHRRERRDLLHRREEPRLRDGVH